MARRLGPSGVPASSIPEFASRDIVVDTQVVNANRVRLFIKPYCNWCHRAIHWLEARGIDFEEVDVVSDESAFEEMIRLSGQELAPVIDVDGEVLADFGPEELAVFWNDWETRHAERSSR